MSSFPDKSGIFGALSGLDLGATAEGAVPDWSYFTHSTFLFRVSVTPVVS